MGRSGGKAFLAKEKASAKLLRWECGGLVWGTVRRSVLARLSEDERSQGQDPTRILFWEWQGWAWKGFLLSLIRKTFFSIHSSNMDLVPMKYFVLGYACCTTYQPTTARIRFCYHYSSGTWDQREFDWDEPWRALHPSPSEALGASATQISRILFKILRTALDKQAISVSEVKFLVTYPLTSLSGHRRT